MALNQEDTNKINYQPDIEWIKERMYRVAEGKKPEDRLHTPSEEKIEPEKLLQDYKDLAKKAQKLDKVIDELSVALSIPIDTEKQAVVSAGVSKLDPASKGEYLSYTLYKDLVNQQEAGKKNVDLDFLLKNYTSDIYANSNTI